VGWLKDLGTGLAAAGEHFAAVRNLMDMSEAAGIAHLRNLIPRAIDEHWFDSLVSMLRSQEGAGDLSSEDRQKAKTFRVYSQEFSRGYS
jgi:hypothetical protein